MLTVWTKPVPYNEISLFDGYNEQISTKSVERAMRSIKENLWKHLDGSKYANYISAVSFS